MPALPMMMYFQAASSELFWLYNRTSKTEASVLDSIATQSRPTLLTRGTAIMVATKIGVST